MRNVNTSHRSTLAAPTSRAVRSTGSAKATYTASGAVVPMATRRAILLARRSSSRVQLRHSPPIAVPGVVSPHFGHGWLGPNPLDHGAGELGPRSPSPPPQIRCADLVLHDRRFDRPAQPLARLQLADVIEHHRGREHLRRWIGDPLPRDVGGRAMHRLEDSRVRADVGPGGESKATDQSCRFVGEDIAEQVGRHDDIELLRLDDELHGGVVDDLVVRRNRSRVLFGDASCDLEKEAGGGFQNVCLMDNGHLLTAVYFGIFERSLRDALAAFARDDRHGLRHGAAVAADLERVVESDVQPFGVLADDDEIDMLGASARDDGLGGPHVRVEIELLAQRYIDRPIPAPDGRGERTLETESGTAAPRGTAAGTAGTGLFLGRHAAPLLVPHSFYSPP